MAKKPKRTAAKKPARFVDSIITKSFRGLLHKVGAATSTVASGRTRTWMFTTDDVDREGQVIEAAGWNFADFIRTGCPIQAFHDYDRFPIGKGSNIRRSGNGWLIDIEFFDTVEGNAALELADAGVLSVSVGFQATESVYDPALGNTRFLAQSLAEISIVPVPSNPYAVMQRASALGRDAAHLVTKMLKAGRRNSQKDQEHLDVGLAHAHGAMEVFPPGSFDNVDDDVPTPGDVLFLDDEVASFGARRKGAARDTLMKSIVGMHNCYLKAGATPDVSCGRCNRHLSMSGWDVVNPSQIPGQPNVAALSNIITRAIVEGLKSRIDRVNWTEPFGDPAARFFRGRS